MDNQCPNCGLHEQFCICVAQPKNERKSDMNFVKKKLTEVSAWAGLFIIICHWLPFWITFAIAVLFVSIDDEKAKKWCLEAAPWLGNVIDEVKSEL